MSRVAVVTGAASGMGPAVSRHLADRGHALLDLQADAVPPESVPATCLRRSRG